MNRIRTYRRYNIVTIGHGVRYIWISRVESFLNNRKQRAGLVPKGFKRVLRNKQELGESWEKYLRPTRLTNEISCVGDGNRKEGSVNNRVGSALLSSDLQLRFLWRLIDGDNAAGMDLLSVSNDMVTRTRYAYNRNPGIFTLDATGHTNQLIFGSSESTMEPNKDAPYFPGCDYAAGQVG